jgi:Adenylate and Guanylate cyclase catalytic domain
VNESQENTHVKDIAEFAMAAVEAAGTILIDEDDPKRGYVRIRVGFHSGPVVSNVIGSLNPRVGHAELAVACSCSVPLAVAETKVISASLTHSLTPALLCSAP